MKQLSLTFEEFMNSLIRPKFIEKVYYEIVDKTLTIEREGFAEWHNGMMSIDKAYCSVRWRYAGATGGSCWGDEAEYYDDPDDEEFLEIFPQICKDVFDFTEEQCEEMMRKIVIFSDEEESGYYGNYDQYYVKTLYFLDAYNYLCENGFIVS